MCPIKIEDVLGLKEGLKRLIEVISQGAGALAAPYLIRKTADARAHEICVISAALNKVAEEYALPVVYDAGKIQVWQKSEDQTLNLEATTLNERSHLRLDYQHRKLQANIETITSIAAAELSDDDSVPDDRPDEDWVTRFFGEAQNVSSEQMQDLWGRILAGEIRSPGRFSLRTLDFVRNLTKHEAAQFSKAGKLALTSCQLAFIDAHDTRWLEKECALGKGYHIELAELGVINSSVLTLKISFDEPRKPQVFTHGERRLIVERHEAPALILLPIWKFTPIGQELLPLVPIEVDENYLDRLGQYFVHRKAKAYLCSAAEGEPFSGEGQYPIIREIVTTSD